MKKFSLFILSLSISSAWACIGTAPRVKIQNNVRVESRAQTGLHIEGQEKTPEIISIQQTSPTEEVKLTVLSKVTEIKDVRPVYKRMLGGTPDYRDVVIPKIIELKPEKVGESLLEYDVVLREAQSTYKMKLTFTPGMIKGGCGGEAKITPL
jgi:hypothetical protein